jgi:hypothetical protein
MLKPRPQVAVFAAAMEEVLKTKDHRGEFLDEVRPIFALDRLFQEVRELDREGYNELHKEIIDPKKLERIQNESVDVSNFAAMVWWACEAIKGNKSKHFALFGSEQRKKREEQAKGNP